MFRFMEYDVLAELGVSVFGHVNRVRVLCEVEASERSRAGIYVDPNSLLDANPQLGQDQVHEPTCLGIMSYELISLLDFQNWCSANGTGLEA